MSVSLKAITQFNFYMTKKHCSDSVFGAFYYVILLSNKCRRAFSEINQKIFASVRKVHIHSLGLLR